MKLQVDFQIKSMLLACAIPKTVAAGKSIDQYTEYQSDCFVPIIIEAIHNEYSEYSLGMHGAFGLLNVK